MFEIRPASKTVIWRRVARYVLWKAEGKWNARGWEPPFDGENDHEYVLRGMMRADNYWPFWDHKERLECMVNDLSGAQAMVAVLDEHATISRFTLRYSRMKLRTTSPRGGGRHGQDGGQKR